jgi:putative sterol carrier protein
MVKFLSKEWNELGKEYILTKLDPEKDLKNVTTSLLAVIEHVPPNDSTMNFFVGLENGKLVDFIVNTGDTIVGKEAVFTVSGTYGTYKSILKGEMSMAIALLRGRLSLKGSKMKALQIIKPLDGVILSLKKVTDEYEE